MVISNNKDHNNNNEIAIKYERWRVSGGWEREATTESELEDARVSSVCVCVCGLMRGYKGITLCEAKFLA